VLLHQCSNRHLHGVGRRARVKQSDYLEKRLAVDRFEMRDCQTEDKVLNAGKLGNMLAETAVEIAEDASDLTGACKPLPMPTMYFSSTMDLRFPFQER